MAVMMKRMPLFLCTHKQLVLNLKLPNETKRYETHGQRKTHGGGEKIIVIQHYSKRGIIYHPNATLSI